MQDILICIREKDKKYCWDQETEQIEEITTKPVAIRDCPENVVLELMKGLGREVKAHREESKNEI
jgi:hypothetical protein